MAPKGALVGMDGEKDEQRPGYENPRGRGVASSRRPLPRNHRPSEFGRHGHRCGFLGQSREKEEARRPGHHPRLQEQQVKRLGEVQQDRDPKTGEDCQGKSGHRRPPGPSGSQGGEADHPGRREDVDQDEEERQPFPVAQAQRPRQQGQEDPAVAKRVVEARRDGRVAEERILSDIEDELSVVADPFLRLLAGKQQARIAETFAELDGMKEAKAVAGAGPDPQQEEECESDKGGQQGRMWASHPRIVEDVPAVRYLRRFVAVPQLAIAFIVVDAVGVFTLAQLVGRSTAGYVAGTAAIVIGTLAFRDRVAPGRRLLALVVLVTILLWIPQLILILAQPPDASVHDGVLLTDAGTDRLLRGLFPYGHDYIDTGARSFFLSDSPVNFGLRHYAYMPGMLLLDIPIRLIGGSHANFSWMFLLALPALAVAAWYTGVEREEKEAALVAVVLNPLLQLDFLYLLNDLFFLAPALGAAAFLRRGRPLTAGVMFGLALSLKQQAILLLPLLIVMAWRHLGPRAVTRAAIGATAVLLVVVGPFLVWDARSFAGDAAGFFFGSGVDSYPIRGLGLPGLLLRAGYIDSRWQAFPSSIFEVAVGLPLLATAAWDLSRRPRWARFWIWNGVLVMVVFFLGRVLAPNYLDLGLVLLTLGFFSALAAGVPAPTEVRSVDRTPGDGRVVAGRA